MSEGLKGIPKIDDDRLSEIGEVPIKLAARHGSGEWYIDVNDYENIFTMVDGIPELIAEIKRLKAELAELVKDEAPEYDGSLRDEMGPEDLKGLFNFTTPKLRDPLIPDLLIDTETWEKINNSMPKGIGLEGGRVRQKNSR